MREKISNETKIYTIVVVNLMLLAVLFLMLGNDLLPREARGFDEAVVPLETQWYVVGINGSKTEITPPTNVDIPKGEWMTVECVLPEIANDRQILMFRSSQQDLKVFIDGTLRDVYTTADVRPFGSSSKSTNVIVDIDTKDSGKVLTVALMSPNDYSGTFNQVYVGTFTGALRLLVIQHGFQLFLAWNLLTIGLVTSAIGVFLQYRYKFVFPMKYAAWAAIASSIQAIAESKLRQFYTPNMSVDAAVSYFIVGVVPTSLVLYVDAIQKGRHKKIHRPMVILCILNMIMNLVLQLTDVQDLMDSLTRTYALCAVTMVTVVCSAVLDFKQGHFAETRVPLIGVTIMYITGIAEIFSQLAHSLRFTTFFLNIGAVVLIIGAVMDSVGQIAKLSKEKHQAVLANSAKSDFLANMSHEIRTPINSIMGMNEMILRESGEDEIKVYASDIKRASENLLDIVNDILDFSKVESGKMDIVADEYELANLVKDTDNVMRVRAESKNLDFKIKADPSCPARLYGDESRVRQAIFNIVGNAIKYTEEGRVTLSISYEPIRNIDNPDSILMRFAVADTGIGIKEEDQGKLFNNFERFELKRNRNIEGSGLGLAITDRIVKLMKGWIKVDSVYGKGSTFTIYIPQGIVGSALIGDVQEKLKENGKNIQSYHESFKAPGRKILVVDDVAMNANVVKGLLKKTEVSVYTALSGLDCIEMCKKEKFDIILMDHFMPNMDGIETLMELRKRKLIDCPVVALTANAISGMKEMFLEKGFSDYLSKPVKPAELEAVVKKYLNAEKDAEN